MSVASGLRLEPSSGVLQRIGARLASGISLLTRAPRMHPARADRTIIWIRTAVVCVALLMVMWLFDVAAITGARHLPRWLVSVFNEITDYGKAGYFLCPLGIAILAIAATSVTLPRAVQSVLLAVTIRFSFLFIAIGLPSLVATIVKRFIGRARPFVGGSADAFLYQPFSWSPAYASMPSGHAVTAFAAATAIGMVWPRLRTVMWIYAVIIAFSRVILTAHHPSDVIAGAVFGVVGAILVRNYFASRRLVFGVSAAGDVVPFAGPSLRRAKSVARALLAD